MKINTDLLRRALTHVKIGAKDLDPVTITGLKEIIAEICSMNSFKEIDQSQLLEMAKLEVNIIYSGEGILDDKDPGHVEWLSVDGIPMDAGREINWKFWNDYNELLIEELPIPSINEIDSMSNKILLRLEDPRRDGKWIRKGMVVGEVQSGKTANYTALTCKAADAGYKIIIILAGMHNNLRAQTQDRLDESFIGFNSDKDDRSYIETFRIGVGNSKNHPSVMYLTTSNEKGDLSKTIAQGAGVSIPSPIPIIMIVKKNKSIIENLSRWAKRCGLRKGEKTIKNCPLLLIDDECDNASINTNKTHLRPEEADYLIPKDEDGNPIKEFDPTAINAGIRTLLNLFDQKSYIGYTATPYANILIHRQAYNKDYGEDLFPKNFILNLPIPSNYIGPIKFFGLDKDEDLGIEQQDRYPLYREINDQIDFVPEKHTKDFEIKEDIPASLKKAIMSFVLSCAARISRGMGNKHNSMLIHVTRFTKVQEQVASLVQKEINKISKRVKYGDGKSSENIWNEFETLWNIDFLEETSIPMGELGKVQSWLEIKPFIHDALNKFEKVKIINGTVGDILEYKKHKSVGINVIAVGGDKLSRGLTLEGLTVSYYLRAAKLYDTLMQMGRWFGYRPGYLDLCRIYTTRKLLGWYKHISLATIELKREFDYMVENDEEPIKYGLKIRSHPDALSVTSLNKMRHGEKRKVTFDGIMAQTLFISLRKDDLINNFNAARKLLNGRKADADTAIGYKYFHVKAGEVMEFLSKSIVHRRNGSFRPEYLVKYIKKLNVEGELINWTVVVLSTKDGDLMKKSIIKEPIYMTKRESEVDVFEDYVQFNKAILSKAHEKLDLSESELYTLNKKDPTPKEIRKARSKKKGLLLIYPLYGSPKENETYGLDEFPVLGYAISFPASGKERDIEYIVDALIAEEG
jgi:hypothetical protein